MVSKYCRLSSPRSDLIIKTRPHAEIIWWGSALKHFSPDDCASLERPVANGRLDIDTPLTLMAENALKDGNAFSNPRKGTKQEIIDLYQKAYDGIY